MFFSGVRDVVSRCVSFSHACNSILMAYSGIPNVRWQFIENLLWQKILIITLGINNIKIY